MATQNFSPSHSKVPQHQKYQPKVLREPTSALHHYLMLKTGVKFDVICLQTISGCARNSERLVLIWAMDYLFEGEERSWVDGCQPPCFTGTV